MNFEKLGAYACKWAAQNPDTIAAAGGAIAAVAADVVIPAIAAVAAVATPIAVVGGVVYGITQMCKGD